MAELTMELRQVLNLTNFELFDFDYEFDDPTFKKELEQAVIDYYYFHEIGQETPDLFKHRFQTRWKRIVPYYNKLYNTTLLSYNPLVNYTITEGLNQLSNSENTQENTVINNTTQTTNATSSNNGSTTSNTDTTNATDTTGNTLTTNDTQTNTTGNTSSSTNDKTSDYPQQSIAGGDFLSGERTSTGTSTNDSTSTNTGTVNVDNTSHSEGTTSNTGSTTSEDTGTSEGTTISDGTTENDLVSRGTTTSNYEKTIEGLTGTSYQELISKERANLLRIQDMVINEMKPSFYLIY